MLSMPIEVKTSSKLLVNLVSRSRMRNRKRRPASSRPAAKLLCHLGHPWAVRIGGDTEDVHDTSLQFDHEQHVVAPEENGIDMEEVGGHDALGLGRAKLAPGWTRSSGSRWETMTAQHCRNARLRHGDTELLELADDPEVAPPGVLPRQAADQLHGLVGQGWTTWLAVRVSPALLHQRPVPAEDRLRRDEERPPALSGHKTGQESDECTIGPAESWTDDLATKHDQLMAKYQDLSVLGRGIQPVDTNGLEDAPAETVEKGQGHGG
jgi:hypothetical protein